MKMVLCAIYCIQFVGVLHTDINVVRKIITTWMKCKHIGLALLIRFYLPLWLADYNIVISRSESESKWIQWAGELAWSMEIARGTGLSKISFVPALYCRLYNSAKHSRHLIQFLVHFIWSNNFETFLHSAHVCRISRSHIKCTYQRFTSTNILRVPYISVSAISLCVTFYNTLYACIVFALYKAQWPKCGMCWRDGIELGLVHKHNTLNGIFSNVYCTNLFN